jgi:hypothetical protein
MYHAAGCMDQNEPNRKSQHNPDEKRWKWEAQLAHNNQCCDSEPDGRNEDGNVECDQLPPEAVVAGNALSNAFDEFGVSGGLHGSVGSAGASPSHFISPSHLVTAGPAGRGE